MHLAKVCVYPGEHFTNKPKFLIRMKTRLILFCTICWILTSCNHEERQPASPPETPKSLQEKQGSGDVFLSKRKNGDDLVETMYEELTDKNPALKEFEATLEQLPGNKADSLKGFNEYTANNLSYYSSANSHAGHIQDSVLREKLKALIAASESRYRKKIASDSSFIIDLDVKTASLEDLHQVLKLAKTLPVMEHYQDDHRPGPAPLKHILRQYEQAIQKTDSLVKK